MRRGPRNPRRALLIVAALLATAQARAQSSSAVQLRAGEHADFSRIVFTLPPGLSFQSQLLGNLLVLTFPHGGDIPGMDPPPAHMLSVTGGTNQAAIGIPAGLHAHVWRIDSRVIVDVFAGAQPAP